MDKYGQILPLHTILEISLEYGQIWTNITFTRYSVDFFRVHTAYHYKDYVSQ